MLPQEVSTGFYFVSYQKCTQFYFVFFACISCPESGADFRAEPGPEVTPQRSPAGRYS